MAAPMEHHDVAPAAESGAARRQAFVTSFGARALTEGFDLDALLAEAAAHAVAGLGVERAKVLQHRPETNDLLVRAGVGWEPGVVGHATLPAGMASPPGRAPSAGRAAPAAARDHGGWAGPRSPRGWLRRRAAPFWPAGPSRGRTSARRRASSGPA